MTHVRRRLAAIAVFVATAAPAWPDVPVAVAVRGGTLGAGIDLDVALPGRVSLRAGYAGFSLDRTVTKTELAYRGTLMLANPSLLVDWRLPGSDFRVTSGVVFSGTKLDASGRPSAAGTYRIGNNTYTASEVGSVAAEFKFRDAVAPYLGIGWGNVVPRGLHWSFLADLGVMYTGVPSINVSATCAAPLATVCTQLQSDVVAERNSLSADLAPLKWYPVVSFGVGYRF